MEAISIVILNFNGKSDTLDCINSFHKNAISYNASIIVVDNGSRDDSVSAIKSKFPEVIVLENNTNLGFSQGNNVGIDYAIKQGATYILIINNDTLLDKNLFKELLKVIKSDNLIGIAVPKIYFAKGFEFHKDRYKKDELGNVIWYAGGIMDWNNVIGFHRGVDQVDRGQYEKIEETTFATGNCMFVKKEVFEKIGFFDKRYFLYYEDNDFSMRVKKAGFKIMYSPKACIWHKNASSSGGSGSSLQDYYITRNRLLFGMRYAPIRARLALIRESFKLLATGRIWQKRGVLDFYLNKLGKGSFPV